MWPGVVSRSCLCSGFCFVITVSWSNTGGASFSSRQLATWYLLAFLTPYNQSQTLKSFFEIDKFKCVTTTTGIHTRSVCNKKTKHWRVSGLFIFALYIFYFLLFNWYISEVFTI